MKKQNFNTDKLEDINASLYDSSNLVGVVIDLLSSSISQFEAKEWDELTNHQITMAAYNLSRDSGKLLTLLNILDEKLLISEDKLEKQIGNLTHLRNKVSE